jgi:hypothetical protein
MDHEKHIVKMSPLKCHRPVGEFSILEDEERNPTREAITERTVACPLLLLRTALDGMPSTRIMRLSFFSPSSASPDRLDFDDLC